MKPKIIISVLSIGILSAYIIGVKGDPILFILFPVLFFFIFLYILIKKKKYISLICLLFFLFGGWAINYYFLPEIFHPVNTLGNFGILIFTLFVGWSLKRTNKKTILSLGTVLFIFFILLLIAISPKTHKHVGHSSTAAIKSLPYLTWIPSEQNIQKRGVVKYDQKHSFEGINFYCSRNLSEAYFMDMSGEIIHKWSAKVNEDDTWQHIEMCRNGDLLAMVKDKMLVRLDWDSNIKWVKKMRAHHDIAVAENNDIYTLTRKYDMVFYYGIPILILNDYIVVLSSDGKIKKELSLFKIVKNENIFSFLHFFKIYFYHIQPPNLIKMIKKRLIEKGFLFEKTRELDIFHTNTIEIINKNIYGVCKKGDLLLSIKKLDLIGILNIEQEKIVWKWGPGNLSKQHHPTVLENNNILIFDNGVDKKYSRIIEIDPRSNKIVWEYTSNPPEEFYSYSRGSSQKFPNGNILISESDSGHIFEITNNGEIVWEFYNPEIHKDNKSRATIYRMMRIIDLENYPRLKNLR